MAVPGVTGVELAVAPGRFVAPPPEGNRYLGFVFARAAEPAGVEQALQAARRHLEVRVDANDGTGTSLATTTSCP